MISITQIILLCTSTLAIDNCATAKLTNIYYPVSGNTVKQVRASLDKNHINGFDGFTNWTVRKPTCNNGIFNYQLILKMTLPKLDANSSVQPQFKEYLTALIRHENLHVQNGRDACMEVSRAVAMSGVKCGGDVRSIADPIFTAHNDTDVKIDLDTNHGMKDGACFPKCQIK